MLSFHYERSRALRLAGGVALTTMLAWPQENGPVLQVPLVVASGSPLRVYLTKRVSKHLDAPVQGKVLSPLFAFDREVIPTGTEVLGHVTRLERVNRWTRARAILGGDFTPLRIAEIQFTSLVLPDGRKIDIQTAESSGLNSTFPLRPPKPQPAQAPGSNGGVLGTARQKAREQINAVKGIPDLVRGTDKRAWLYDYMMSRLPYHPQYVHNRTRFDVVLTSPLRFGSEPVKAEALSQIGTQPGSGSIAHARLLTSINSLDSKPGERVEAVLEQPLFSADHKLLLPEGTRVEGTVGMAKRAGWFHHAGRLRFTFQDIELTPQVVELKAEALRSTSAPAAAAPQHGPDLKIRTQAQLTGAEGASAPVKVDSEGGVQAKESKTRFVGTAAALLITHRAADNDEGRNHISSNGQNSNVSGRTLGGGLGFGLLGSIAAQASNNVGAAFAYYGMGWSVFSTVIARGAEVQFDRNAAIDIGFNPRPAAKGK